MQGQRNFGLDLSRAIAITMVYFAHGVKGLLHLGMGVDLFFVLSGFLIGRIYFRSEVKPNFSPWRFWQARWWRTLPPYYAALGIAWFLGLKFGLVSPQPIHWYYLLFLQNYLGAEGFGVTWSLCVEEHFYLVLPIACWILVRLFGRKSLIWILPLAVLIPQCLRTVSMLTSGLQGDWYWASHLHSEGLILGVFLAYLFVDHPSIWQRIKPMAYVLSLIPSGFLVALSIHYPPSPNVYGGLFLYYALGFAGWLRVSYDLTWAPVSKLARLAKSSIHGLALCSYSVYLLHTLFFAYIRLSIPAWPRGPAKTLFVLVATMVPCVLFYFSVERPAIIWRDRHLKRRKLAAVLKQTVQTS